MSCRCVGVSGRKEGRSRGSRVYVSTLCGSGRVSISGNSAEDGMETACGVGWCECRSRRLCGGECVSGLERSGCVSLIGEGTWSGMSRTVQRRGGRPSDVCGYVCHLRCSMCWFRCWLAFISRGVCPV